jgi:hypothetical protein
LPCPPVFCDLAVLGAVGGGLASIAHEWLLQRLGAVTAQPTNLKALKLFSADVLFENKIYFTPLLSYFDIYCFIFCYISNK